MDRPIGILTMFYENLLVEYFAEQMCMQNVHAVWGEVFVRILAKNKKESYMQYM